MRRAGPGWAGMHRAGPGVARGCGGRAVRNSVCARRRGGGSRGFPRAAGASGADETELRTVGGP